MKTWLHIMKSNYSNWEFWVYHTQREIWTNITTSIGQFLFVRGEVMSAPKVAAFTAQMLLF